MSKQNADNQTFQLNAFYQGFAQRMTGSALAERVRREATILDGGQVQESRRPSGENMKEAIKRNAIGALLVVAMIFTHSVMMYAGYHAGMKDYHETIAGDMLRYEDAPIPFENKHGRFYLFHGYMTFNEWVAKQRSER